MGFGTYHSDVGARFIWQAYRTWLGFYKGFLKMCKWTPERLVQTANLFAATLGALPAFHNIPLLYIAFCFQTCERALSNNAHFCFLITGVTMFLNLQQYR